MTYWQHLDRQKMPAWALLKTSLLIRLNEFAERERAYLSPKCKHQMGAELLLHRKIAPLSARNIARSWARALCNKTKAISVPQRHDFPRVG